MSNRGYDYVQSGLLRRRVDIQTPVRGKDSAGGPIVSSWRTLYKNVPAAFDAGVGREYYAAAAHQVLSEGLVSILIRYHPGVTAEARIVHYTDWTVTPPTAELFNIESIMADITGRKYLTLLCRKRDAKGFRADG